MEQEAVYVWEGGEQGSGNRGAKCEETKNWKCRFSGDQNLLLKGNIFSDY